MTTGYRPIRVLRWIALNGLFSWGVWMAIVGHSVRAENVITFVTGFAAVLATLVVFSEDAKMSMRKEGTSVPRGVDGIFDIIIVCVFASEGWWWMATAWVWLFFANCVVFAEPDKTTPPS